MQQKEPEKKDEMFDDMDDEKAENKMVQSILSKDKAVSSALS